MLKILLPVTDPAVPQYAFFQSQQVTRQVPFATAHLPSSPSLRVAGQQASPTKVLSISKLHKLIRKIIFDNQLKKFFLT